MGKQTDNNRRNNAEPDDEYELKVLIDKCNVCHSNLGTDHHKTCKHHGEPTRRGAVALTTQLNIHRAYSLRRPERFLIDAKCRASARDGKTLLNYDLFVSNL